MKALVWTVAFVVAVVVNVVAGARSRRRLRALMNEGPNSLAPCTVDRRGVERFLEEARILRGVCNGVLEWKPAAGALNIGAHGLQLYRDDQDDDQELRLGECSRILAEWLAMFEHVLDDEDRAALASRGVSREGVLGLREPETHDGTGKLTSSQLRRLVAELERIEERLVEVPRSSVYR